MTSIATKDQYLSRAVKYADEKYREGRNNANRFSAALGRDLEAWCADFQCGVAQELDPKNWRDLIPDTASCRRAIAMWKSWGCWHQGRDGLSSGDIGYLGPFGSVHTFIVVNVLGSDVYTVEGNTNDDGSSNGDGVYLRRRSILTVYGYGRPKYDTGGRYYRPKSGEDWYDVSEKYKKTLEELRVLNGGSLNALIPGRGVRVD